MKVSNARDIYLKSAKRYLSILGIKPKVNYWTKYHELYLKGEFNLEHKKKFLEQWFKDSVGYFPDIDNPKTLNEKIQWYKLYYHTPLITKCIDKVSFKDHIAEVLGDEYVIPSLGVYSSADEINFDELPNQFVIKANFGSDAKEVIIVTDKSKLDIPQTCKTISSWEKPWWRSAWGGYEFIQPKILIEEYIDRNQEEVHEFKFMCFNGNPKYVVVHIDPLRDSSLAFYDLYWKRLVIAYSNHPSSKREIERSKYHYQMIEISKRIAKQFPLVRVDFFEANNRLNVGELTFYPGGGMNKYLRKSCDYKLGEMLRLPVKTRSNLGSAE